MSKICRVCLVLIESSMESVNINTVEESTGFMPLRDKLALCVPEMVLDMIQEPVMCSNCIIGLQAAYDFKNKCLQTEEKIRRLIQCVGGVIYSIDLSKIATKPQTEVKASQKMYSPKFKAKVIQKVEKRPCPVIIKRIIREPIEIQSTSSEIDASSMDVGEIEFKDVNEEKLPAIPGVSGPFIISAVEKRTDPLCVVKHEESHAEVINEGYELLEEDYDEENKFLATIKCNFCQKNFSGMYMLRAHQKECTAAKELLQQEASANNCNVQMPVPMLRRRRRTVTKDLRFKANRPQPQQSPTNSDEAPKTTRQNLPLKAKNFLQKWLFQHRENPYPTDAEKLYLIKQTNLTLVQVENWFINARRRILQRMLAKTNTFSKNYGKSEKVNSDDEIELI